MRPYTRKPLRFSVPVRLSPDRPSPDRRIRQWLESARELPRVQHVTPNWRALLAARKV